MKVLMMIALMLSFSESKLLINGYQRVPGMDYQMELSVPNPAKRVLLDCQSFFNGVHYQSAVNGKWKDDWSMIIDGNDCEDVSMFAKNNLDAGNPFCLNVDPEEKSIEVSSNLDECPQQQLKKRAAITDRSPL